MFGLSGRQVFILLLLVMSLFAGSRYAPAYFAVFELNDYVRQEVKYAFTARKTPEALRADIVQKGKDLDIPIQLRDIKITRRGPSFTLEVEYHWPIDLKVYHHELVFHTVETGEVFENAPY
jgi:hypothetical protein